MTPAATQAGEQYWTVEQLASHFHVSKWTIYRRYRAEGWPHSEIGGIRFSGDDVAVIKDLIRQDAAQPAAPAPTYSTAQLARASKRLGLPAPRRGS